MLLSEKTIQFFIKSEVCHYADMMRIVQMWLSDNEDWLYCQLLERDRSYLRNEFIRKKWIEFIAYVHNHKDFYFKYIKNDKN